MKDKQFLIYKITNLIDNKFYIGAHITNNINDGYMGSGKKIKYAIKKHGIKNFTKEILYILESKEEMYEKEYEEINKVLHLDNCYNIITGGHGGYPLNTNKVIVKDSNGNTFKVDKNDPRYISGELVSWNKGIKQSAEINLKRSKTLKGRIPWNKLPEETKPQRKEAKRMRRKLKKLSA